MRNANPDQLDQLADLLTGRGGAEQKIDEAFTRASALGVSSKLAALRPMRTWVSETAPDLRKRATIARLEDGDPQAGLRWAGFGPGEVTDAVAMSAAPDLLVLAAAMGLSDDPGMQFYRRRSNESWHDWVDRVRAHGVVGALPALEPYEEQIKETFGLAGDVTGFLKMGGRGALQGSVLTKVLVANSVSSGGWANSLKMWTAAQMGRAGAQPWAPSKVTEWGAGLRRWTPTPQSLAAPGSWLPSRLGALASGNATYQDISRIPFVNRQIGVRIGTGVDHVRRWGFLNRPIAGQFTTNQFIDAVLGSDALAAEYGGLSHSGAPVTRSGSASYWKVARNATTKFLEGGDGRFKAVGKGIGTAGKMGGLWRFAGVAGGLVATGFSAANVWAQGDPRGHFGSREQGAKYVADVAELGFNASLTAAMIAPNPWTIGAVAVTGLIYGGAKIVEHWDWDGIKAGAGKAKDWTRATAKSVARKLNPFHR
ncbi:PE-PGRS family protein [Streptomyces sp. NPDC060031]|uniref:PE-PGRS family protein n=1 Tax=Streptomyces sp. NPDC060031 TaxID=3347043 RepID=UPI0036994349